MVRIKNYLRRLYDIIVSPSMSYLPGNIAFYLVLSIFPILTLIGVLSQKLGVDVDSLVSAIDTAFPQSIANILDSFVQGKGFDTNMGIFMIIGFFLASNGADAIILASNNLYGFPNSSYIKRRIKAMFMILLLILLIIFMLGFLAFGNSILNLSLSFITNKKLVALIYNLFLILKWPFAIFVIYFNVKLIYSIAPDWKILSKHTTKGAIFTTIMWILIIQVYSFWVTHISNYDLFYGSLSNIAVLMLLTFLLSYILVIGIAINVKSYEYKIED